MKAIKYSFFLFKKKVHKGHKHLTIFLTSCSVTRRASCCPLSYQAGKGPKSISIQSHTKVLLNTVDTQAPFLPPLPFLPFGPSLNQKLSDSLLPEKHLKNTYVLTHVIYKLQFLEVTVWRIYNAN